MPHRLWELAALFSKLGIIGFGGPAVHIATMEEETVQRRGWLSRDHFLDMVGATNLIPGPNSTEMAMHVGYHRAGFVGLVVAGAAFILPAVLITTVFAVMYVRLGQLPQVQPILAGIKPAVVAIIFVAGYRLAAKAIKNWLLGAVAVGVIAAAMVWPGNEIKILLAGGLVGLIAVRVYQAISKTGNNTAPGLLPPLFFTSAFWQWVRNGTIWMQAAAPLTGSQVEPLSLWKLGLFFLKVGAVLYGSGYVLFAYLEGGLVHDFHWLTRDQLIDAVAVGQLTPGPILSTATFIGFVVMCPTADGNLLAGAQGAVVASVAIFLPSFFFVAALGPVVPRLRKNATLAAFLDAINAASIGLMGAITLKLCGDVFFVKDTQAVNWISVLIAGISCALLLRWKLSPAWLVGGGAVAGWAMSLGGLV